MIKNGGGDDAVLGNLSADLQIEELEVDEEIADSDAGSDINRSIERRRDNKVRFNSYQAKRVRKQTALAKLAKFCIEENLVTEQVLIKLDMASRDLLDIHSLVSNPSSLMTDTPSRGKNDPSSNNSSIFCKSNYKY